ncbi:MAG: alpha/beta hydrolase [Methylococcaceae bacterium]
MGWKVPEDTAKHVVFLKVIIQSKDEFFNDLKDRIRASGNDSAFLFIHGYNVSFKVAARRTAQIWYDLNFKGAPVFYSWPSQGNMIWSSKDIGLAYSADEDAIVWTQKHLKEFLKDFFAQTKAQNVYLIAHSMGNRALKDTVIALLAEEPSLRQRLKEIILAAPDIDADIFKQQIAKELAASSSSTLYASSEDCALKLSEKIHGGYPRAGDSGQGLTVVPGIETVDASDMDTSLFGCVTDWGHSYFADNRSVLADIFYLIRDGLRADQRFSLRSVDTQEGRHWVFKK